MTVQSVIKEVCSFVGVRPPNGSVFVSPYVDRTSWEFVQLANEKAQSIAYDTRDWTVLKNIVDGVCLGDGAKASFPLPPDYKRMLLTSNIWRNTSTQQPMTFVSDADDWMRRRNANETNSWGEWIILGDQLHIHPTLQPGNIAMFPYLSRNCINQISGGITTPGNQFLTDADIFRIDERLLKLAMIWQWKCNKGATYAEDLANYEDALAKVAGADKPSPILIDGQSPIYGWGSNGIYG
jgi:hypothetical protein